MRILWKFSLFGILVISIIPAMFSHCLGHGKRPDCPSPLSVLFRRWSLSRDFATSSSRDRAYPATPGTATQPSALPDPTAARSRPRATPRAPLVLLATEQNREIREGQSGLFPGSKQCENIAGIIEITKISKRLNFQRIRVTWVIFLKAYELWVKFQGARELWV